MKTIDETELIFQLALTELHAVSLRRQIALLEHFGNATAIFGATAVQLAEFGLEPDVVSTIRRFSKHDFYRERLLGLAQSGVRVLSCLDPAYPLRLKETAAYPILLYGRGDFEILRSTRFLAVVGSREMTRYGEEAAAFLIPKLVKLGFVIVSGMAIGVDACAHRVCLNAGGKTVAVQAQGVDQAYPRANHKLFESILESGLVLSEFHCSPHYAGPEIFPKRNRIVSGLCDGVLVIEAREKSGSLVTAYFGLEQNRQVYAVPGNIDQPMSRGCLQLIKRGAKVVTEPQDILEDFDLTGSESIVPSELNKPSMPKKIATDHFESPLEQRIFEICSESHATLDDLIELTGEAAPSVTAIVTKMELLGRLREAPGRRFQSVA